MYFIKYLFIKLLIYTYYKLNNYKSFKESRLSDYFHLILLLIIKSNHVRRPLIYLNKKNNSHEFKEINWGQVKNPENIYIIIGDSNSEFLGRNYKKNAKTKCIFYTLWTGPTLMISFCKSKEILDKTIFLIQKIIYLHGVNKKYHFVFSFGQIDIRTVFYNFLIVEKYFKNEKEIINNYVTSFNEIVKIFKKKIKQKFKNLKFEMYFKEINPSSGKKGSLPSREKINSLNRKLAFPVFGELKQRVRWRNKLNKNLLNYKGRVYKFILNDKRITNKSGIFDKKYGDGNHITDNNLIIEFQKNLIERKKIL